MKVHRRLGAAALVATLTAVAPVVVAAPAAADPCSVFVPGPQSRMMPQQAPQQRMLPRLPILHLPIGRKPAEPGTVTTPDSAIMTPSAALLPDASGQPVPNPAVPQSVLPDDFTPDSIARNVTEPAQPRSAAPTAVAAAGEATMVEWVTGAAGPGEVAPNNTYSRFGISGTDLGIMWDNGYSGADRQLLMAFGDTFGNCDIPGQEWRSNVLFRTSDTDPAHGISVPAAQYGNLKAGSPVNANRPNFSKQIINSLGLANEVTIIPTAAISVGTTQYINFMSISAWGQPGSWSTNFSAIAVSNDNGENWTVPQSSIRPSMFFAVPSVFFMWGEQNFQQQAYVKKDGYVYAYGTTPGRGGSVFLSRVAEGQITDRWAYEYYTPFGWVRWFPFLAIQVVFDRTSELSVAYSKELDKFLMLYTNTFNNVVMRTAENPEGPWSDATTLVSAAGKGGIYAPYIHPWSPVITGDGNELYFTMSQWSNYNVALMKATVS